MKIVTEHQYDIRVCVMRLSGELDINTVPDVRSAMEGAVSRGCVNVVLDLARVTYADSSVLILIVGADRLLKPKGGRIVLAGAERNIARVIELSGLVGAARTVFAARDATDAIAGLSLPSVGAAPLWSRDFEWPAVPESLSASRQMVCDALDALQFPEATMFDLRVGVGEALANAIRHGSTGCAGEMVTATVTAYPDRVTIEVRDSGQGFGGEAESADDPYASSGRGVMFMRALMDRVDFVRPPEGGTSVTLVKHR